MSYSVVSKGELTVKQIWYAALAAAVLTIVPASLPADAAPTTGTANHARAAATTFKFSDAPFSSNSRQFRLDRPARFDYQIRASAPVDDATIQVNVPDGVTYTTDSETTFDGIGHDFTFVLTVAEAGWKTVTVRVAAAGATTATLTLRVYGVGGPPPTATGSLAGRAFASSSGYYNDDAGWLFPRRDLVWFLDGKFVYLGVPQRGRPTCTAAMVKPSRFYGCQRYWWNKERNLLQIGTWIGSVQGRTLRYFSTLSGLPWDLSHPVGTAPAGKRFQGTWREAMWQAEVQTVVTLTLRQGGTFVLKQKADNKVTTYQGRYVIGKNGRLVLKRRNGTTAVRTLAIGKNRRGRLDPHHSGMFLSMPGLTGAAKSGWLTPVG